MGPTQTVRAHNAGNTFVSRSVFKTGVDCHVHHKLSLHSIQHWPCHEYSTILSEENEEKSKRIRLGMETSSAYLKVVNLRGKVM